MKTIKFILLLAFLSSPIFIFSNFRPKKEPLLQTTVQADPANNQLRVTVQKPENEPITLRFLEEEGWTLHEQIIGGKSTTVQTNLNLCALPNGTYRVEVSQGNRIQTQMVQLLPSDHPTLKRQIDVWPM